MNIVLLGAPGSGKGSQAELLANDFNMVQISTGDLIRSAISEKTGEGVLANEYVTKGMLVPDDVVLSILKLRLKRSDTENGVIFDGYPRSVLQAKSLEAVLTTSKKNLDAIIYITSTTEVIVERLLSRRMCESCGKVYNMITNPPKDNKCEECGGNIVSRSDDNEKIIRNRLDVYNETTKPLVDFYSEKGLLHEINGDRKIIEVYEEIKEVMKVKLNIK